MGYLHLNVLVTIRFRSGELAGEIELLRDLGSVASVDESSQEISVVQERRTRKCLESHECFDVRPELDRGSVIRLVLLLEFVESKLIDLVLIENSSGLEFSSHGHEI